MSPLGCCILLRLGMLNRIPPTPGCCSAKQENEETNRDFIIFSHKPYIKNILQSELLTNFWKNFLQKQRNYIQVNVTLKS